MESALSVWLKDGGGDCHGSVHESAYGHAEEGEAIKDHLFLLFAKSCVSCFTCTLHHLIMQIF
jgi:hypothetical protein